MTHWLPLAIEHGRYDPLMAGSIDGTDKIPHDRAVVRAMSAKCESLEVDMCCKQPRPSCNYIQTDAITQKVILNQPYS